VYSFLTTGLLKLLYPWWGVGVLEGLNIHTLTLTPHTLDWNPWGFSNPCSSLEPANHWHCKWGDSQRFAKGVARFGHKFEVLHDFALKPLQKAVEGTIISNNSLWVFQTGSPSFAWNSVSALILVFGTFICIYGHIWPHQGHGGSPRRPTYSRAWENC